VPPTGDATLTICNNLSPVMEATFLSGSTTATFTWLYPSQPSSIDRIMAETSLGSFDPDDYRFGSETVTAEQIFENQKIRDLISKAEMERTDKRRRSRPNVFFGREKRLIIEGQWGGRTWQPLDFRSSTIPLNAAILAAWILLPLVILFLVLRRQLRRV
jgi:hypothetical protein